MSTPAVQDMYPFDPEGSIFLPKTEYPEREFDRWYFELLIGRGVGRDRQPQELFAMNEELTRMRQRYLGKTACREQ